MTGMTAIVEPESGFKYEGQRRGIRCPHCNNYRSRVLYTYRNKDGAIRRERECMYCHRRFPTNETPNS